MIGTARATLLALAACLTLLCPLAAQTPVLTEAAPASAARIEPVSASHGMVVAQEGRAARIGVEVLERGGNAVIGVRYDATELLQGVTEVLCYGTAVFVEKNP